MSTWCIMSSSNSLDSSFTFSFFTVSLFLLRKIIKGQTPSWFEPLAMKRGQYIFRLASFSNVNVWLRKLASHNLFSQTFFKLVTWSSTNYSILEKVLLSMSKSQATCFILQKRGQGVLFFSKYYVHVWVDFINWVDLALSIQSIAIWPINFCRCHFK